MPSRDKTALFSSLSKLKQLSDTHSNSRLAAPTDIAEQTEQELEDLILDLRSRVKDQEDALKRLRAQSSSKEPSLKTLKAAYKTRATSLPAYVPPANTTLDTVTAISLIHDTSTSLARSLTHTSQIRDELQAQLDSEDALLEETQELNKALKTHLVELQDTEQELKRGGSKVRKEKEKEMHDKATKTQNEASMLLRELRDFIESVLNPMIKVEDAGGPVVGEELNKEKLADILATATKKAGKKGQPTIAQMWGAGDRPERDDPTTQFKMLLEAIMNAATDPQASPYVEIRRESAASRFLVRTGIARFHPRDARKIKLVDFGRTLEDE